MSCSLLASSFKGPVPSSNHTNACGSPVLLATEFQPQEQVWGQGSVLACLQQSPWPSYGHASCTPHSLWSRASGRLTTESPVTAGQVAVGLSVATTSFLGGRVVLIQSLCRFQSLKASSCHLRRGTFCRKWQRVSTNPIVLCSPDLFV